MRRRARGWSLLEAMVVTVLTFLVLNMLAVAAYAFRESHGRVSRAIEDLDLAAALMEDLKDDLRRTRRLAVEEGAVTVDGAIYRIRGGTVERRGEGRDRDYLDAFEEVTFRREGRFVTVGLRLRSHGPGSPIEPRLGMMVFCREVPE